VKDKYVPNVKNKGTEMANYIRTGMASVELQLKEALKQWRQRVEEQISEYEAKKGREIIDGWTVRKWLRYYDGQRNKIVNISNLLEANYTFIRNMSDKHE
jgi:hypothetical protein